MLESPYLYLRGTKLGPSEIRKPLTRPLLVCLGFFFMIGMHLYVRNIGGSGLMLPFNAAGAIFISLAIGIGLLEIARQHSFAYNYLSIGLIIGGLLLSIPAFYPQSELIASVSRLIWLWGGIFFFITLQQFTLTPQQRQILLWFILFSVLMESLFAWQQFLFLDSDNHIGYDAVSNRPYGIFQQPNMMASFLATGLIISGYLLTRFPAHYETMKLNHWFTVLTPVFVIPLLFFLQSRVGWLAAVIGVVYLLPYLYNYASKKLLVLWIAMIVFSGFVTLSVADYMHWSLPQQDSTFVSYRWFIWPQALKMCLEHIYSGIGYGNFSAQYIAESAQWQHANAQAYSGIVGLQHPYNMFLYWVVEGGILALFGLATICIFAFISIRRAVPGTRRALFAMLLPILIHTQLDEPFYYSLAHTVIFFVLLYWIDAFGGKKRIRLKRTRLIVLLGYVQVTLISLFLVSSLVTGHYVAGYMKNSDSKIYLDNHLYNGILWQAELDNFEYNRRFDAILVAQNSQGLKDYIMWGIERAKKYPNPKVYRNLVLAYQALGENEKANMIQNEANYLFAKIMIDNR